MTWLSVLIRIGLIVVLVNAVASKVHKKKSKHHDCGFYYHSWYKRMGFCKFPSVPYIGDFNGDKRSDMLCHNTNGSVEIAYATKTGTLQTVDWCKDLKWCNQSGDQIYMGDFNGDGQADMLCNNKLKGRFEVMFATWGGHFHDIGWDTTINWCTHPKDQLLLGDFNGDERTDLLCLSRLIGTFTIAYADCDGEFAKPKHGIRWCSTNESEIVIGDYNGDRRSDLLCHYYSGGKEIAYADFKGDFKGVDWANKTMGWCKKNNIERGEVLVGDVNGDGRSDLICHDTIQGNVSVAFSNKQGHFIGTGWHRKMGFCVNRDGDQILVGDFNCDHLSDMFCHTRKGRVWISYAECYK